MNFTLPYWNVVETEEDLELLKAEADKMTYDELAKKYNITRSKMYAICHSRSIRAKTPERKIRLKKQKVKVLKTSYADRELLKWVKETNNGKLHNVYYDMLKRCHDPKNKGFAYYGARGISVCTEWRENCRVFYQWARENGYAQGLTLDRIDNSKGYCPENCRWVTAKVQTMNRDCTRWVVYNGIKHTLKDWSELTGLSYRVLADRIYRYGWTIERALTEKINIK